MNKPPVKKRRGKKKAHLEIYVGDIVSINGVEYECTGLMDGFIVYVRSLCARSFVENISIQLVKRNDNEY